MPTRKAEVIIEPSLGNFFADLRLPCAAELDVRVSLAVEINRAHSERGLTDAAASKLHGHTQPKLAALKGYKLDGYSVETLRGFLGALGR